MKHLARLILAAVAVSTVSADAGPGTLPSAAPSIIFEPTNVPFVERSKLRDFTIQITYSAKPMTMPSVEFFLDTGRGEPRSFVALHEDEPGGPRSARNVYRAMATLVPEYLHPVRLRIIARYAVGSLTCNVEDTELLIGKQAVMLGEIRHMDCGKSPTVVLTSGEVLHEMPSGLRNLRGDLGPVAVNLNLASADEFTVEAIHPSLKSVAYRVLVKEGDHVVAEKSGEVAVEGTPAETQPAVR